MASTAEFMHFVGHESCELNDDDDLAGGIDRPLIQWSRWHRNDELFVTMDKGRPRLGSAILTLE